MTTSANRSTIGGALLCALVVCGLPAACDRSRPDPLAEIHDLAGVPLSAELAPAVAQARRELAAPEPAGDVVDQLTAFDILVPRIDRPESRAAAAAELTERWRDAPGEYAWLQIARNNEHLLGGHFDYDTLLAHPLYADTTGGPGAFVKALFRDERGKRGERFLAMDVTAEDSLSLNRVWLLRKQAVALHERGAGAAGVQLLLTHLPTAHALGGARLAARYWTTIGYILRRSEHLDDALHAQVTQVAFWRKLGAEYNELRGRLRLADILQERRELTGAYAIIDTCIASARRLNHPWILTECLNKAAGFHAEAGDLERALSFDLQSLEVARALQDSFNVPVTITNVAYDLRLLGRLAECRAYLDEGRRWVAAFPDPRLVAGYPLREVPYYLHVGDYATADSLLQEVMGRMPAASLAVEEAEFHLEQIDFARDLGRADLAYRSIARLEELRHALYDKLADSNRVAEFAMATADVLAQQGEFRRAAAALADAADAVERGGGEGMAWKLARSQGELALLRDDPEGAQAAFARGLELAEAGSEPAKLVESRFLVGTALLEADRPEEALRMLEVVGADEAFGPRFRIRLSMRLYAEMARARIGSPAAAVAGFRGVLAECNRYTPPDLLIRLHLELGRALERNGEIAAAEDHLGQAAQILRDADARTFSADLRLANRELRRDLVESMVGFVLDHPQRLGGLEAATLALAVTELAGSGGAGDAPDRWPGLWYFVGRERSFRWLRDEEGLEIAELPGEEALTRLVAPVVADVRRPDRKVEPADLARLGEVLFGPLGDRWPAGRTLHLGPDGVLHAVPWALLPLLAADGTEAAPALVRGPLCEVPAVVAPRGSPVGQDRARRLLALGDDRPLSDADRGATESLRHAEAEAASIAALWPDDTVTLKLGAEGDGLTAADLEGHDVVHIASHARISEGLPNRTTMRLAAAGAPLTATGVLRRAFAAELIYLSCCEADRPLAAGGLGSFARACLTAGAGAVIASGQRIDDEASAALAASFYRHWLAGASKAAALRAAQLEIRRARPDWAHPYYWATYRLIGDPR